MLYNNASQQLLHLAKPISGLIQENFQPLTSLPPRDVHAEMQLLHVTRKIVRDDLVHNWFLWGIWRDLWSKSKSARGG